MTEAEFQKKSAELVQSHIDCWPKFARDVFGITLDKDQEAILESVQLNKKTSVASGTARGKDFITAVAGLCFLYLTPKWNEQGELTENTKVAFTAPTARQVQNIMTPEFTRLFNAAKKRGFNLPGRLTGNDIRTESKEWFLTGFKADNTNKEAWAGFHAINTMFAVTEASGMPDMIFDAIEGNLQGNSRLLVVFNPNVSIGYAARSQKEVGWAKFTLNSLTAPNVIEKKIIIPGQVDYEWVKDKLINWCETIRQEDFLIEQNDFEFEGIFYRPNDKFRVKVLGRFPKVSADALIPGEWIEEANKRWTEKKSPEDELRLGVDVAGMGRDSSVFCYRYKKRVGKFRKIQSAGKANHMEVAGIIANELKTHAVNKPSFIHRAFIDTIGEGAGVYSRLVELGYKNAFSAKASEGAKATNDMPLKDVNNVEEFANMRAYMFWALRDWLNPQTHNNPEIPPDEELYQELTEILWNRQSNGKIIIEPKEDIVERIGRSPDKADALADTFYPNGENISSPLQNKIGYFR